MHPFERHRRNQYKPRDARKFYDWAKGINLPAAYSFKGAFDIDLSPWLRAPGDALEDDLVREVTCIAAVRTGKTLLGDLFLAKKAATDRAPSMFNIGDEQNAKEHSKLRFKPLLNAIPDVVSQFSMTNRFAVTDSLIQFSDGTYILIQGLENPANFDAKGICWMVNDELHKAKRGNLDKARSRTSDFRHRCKILNISQGGIVDDDGDIAYKMGSMERWGFHCLKCGMLQPFEFRDSEGKHRLKWDSDRSTCPNGQWDFDKMAETIRYECANPDCLHEHLDTPTMRREMCGTANTTYMPPANPLAPRDTKSFTWNQFAAPWVPWKEIAIDWIKSHIAFEAGDNSGLKNIIQRRFSQPWSETEFIPGPALNENHSSDYTIVEDHSRFPNIMCGFPWDDEVERYMANDVQEKGGVYFVSGVAAVAKDGRQRMIWAGRLESGEAIRAKQLELGVTDQRVGLDCANDGENTEHIVDALCTQYGWIQLLGSASDMWLHPDPSRAGGMVERHWSKPKRIMIGLGQKSQADRRSCIRFEWSNSYFHGIHHRRVLGKGLYYGVPADIEDFATYVDPVTKKPTGFWKQMRANQRIIKSGRPHWVRIGSRPDHYRDVRCMLLVMAAIGGVLGVEDLTNETNNP